MPYSSVDDLMLGDLLVSSHIDKGKFVTEAAEEIDSKIGFIYRLPLVATGTPPPASLPLHQQLLLKGINNKLASGRLIMTLDIAGEGTALHAYGLRLVTEATQELMLIANGTVDLSAVRLPDNTVSDGFATRSPSIINVDATSAFEDFYDWAKTPRKPGEEYQLDPVWAPGA